MFKHDKMWKPWRNVFRLSHATLIQAMTVTMPEKDVSLIVDKLDQVRLEILRLRAVLIPEEEPTPDERKAVEEARREIREGASKTLAELLKELG